MKELIICKTLKNHLYSRHHLDLNPKCYSLHNLYHSIQIYQTSDTKKGKVLSLTKILALQQTPFREW